MRRSVVSRAENVGGFFVSVVPLDTFKERHGKNSTSTMLRQSSETHHALAKKLLAKKKFVPWQGQINKSK